MFNWPAALLTILLFVIGGLLIGEGVRQRRDLGIFITQVRANGFLLIPGHLYIPESQIATVLVLSDGKKPPGPGESAVIPFPEKQT